MSLIHYQKLRKRACYPHTQGNGGVRFQCMGVSAKFQRWLRLLESGRVSPYIRRFRQLMRYRRVTHSAGKWMRAYESALLVSLSKLAVRLQNGLSACVRM